MAGGGQLPDSWNFTTEEPKEPLYDPKELRYIAPIDHKQQFDIRSVIARVVDGSEFDEFKKLYGTVRPIASLGHNDLNHS